MKRQLGTLWFACGTLALPAAAAEMHCSDLAATILEHDNVLAATSSVVAAAGTTPAYCLINLTQQPAINVRVGLPLNNLDGGTGGAPGKGAWNGKVQNQGGGGYAGTVGSVTGPVTNHFVGSSNDTGHSVAWCNAINPRTGQPNSQPNCGLAGGGFVLDPDNELLRWQVKDFIKDGIHAQTVWALDLAGWYYGQKADRNYWTGCSTGGRQGFQMAQSFGNLFDGFLVGAPAFNWNRFIIAEHWPRAEALHVVGPSGVSPAKSAAANNAAIAACDKNDAVVDGIINEPRRCTFNANSLLCTGKPGEPTTCLTPQEANAIHAIWDGPRNHDGERLWGGLNKGTSFNTLLPGGTGPSVLIETYVINWMHQDPTFDSSSITPQRFPEEFEDSYRKFRRSAATDNPDLDRVKSHGAKIIHYHGIADPLIVPFGSYNYVGRVFERYGQKEAQSFMRSFFYPGVGHCGGGAAPQPNATDLFNTLQDWVERGVAPDYVVASQTLTGGAVRTRKICKYPDEAVYKGSGSTDDQANFTCVVHRKVPEDLEADALTNKDRDRDHDHDHGHDGD